ncbi:T-cell receptor alpha chain V region RL-5 [Anabarilius grahami]|nr:T-cell receptor alpha chain V region RL-5 [Anabarilius grahami]
MLNRVCAYGDNEEEFKKRFNASLNTLTRSVPLMIQDVCVSDSAVYYCALKPTVTQTHSTLTQTLCVSIHNVENNIAKLVCWGQDSVDQPSREQTSAEGNQVTLLCNYTLMSAANAYLFWYKQLPNRSPTFILSDFSIGKGTTEHEFEERFHAKLDSTLGTVPLMIQDVCAFADSIGPVDKDTNMIIREGESVTLRCSYDTSSSYVYLYWYRQYPNREPEYLLYKGARTYSGLDNIPDRRFQSTTSQSSTELIINSVTLSDSALYYCALRVGVQ